MGESLRDRAKGDHQAEVRPTPVRPWQQAYLLHGDSTATIDQLSKDSADSTDPHRFWPAVAFEWERDRETGKGWAMIGVMRMPGHMAPPWRTDNDRWFNIATFPVWEPDDGEVLGGAEFWHTIMESIKAILLQVTARYQTVAAARWDSLADERRAREEAAAQA